MFPLIIQAPLFLIPQRKQGIRKMARTPPTDVFAARDLVHVWETEGAPTQWREYFLHSLQVYSFGYENESHRRECQETLTYVGEVYEMAGYSR